MKTFQDFQNEAAILTPLDTYKKINHWAAKQYAKQFIDEALKHSFKIDNFNTAVMDSDLYAVKDLIDMQ